VLKIAEQLLVKRFAVRAAPALSCFAHFIPSIQVSQMDSQERDYREMFVRGQDEISACRRAIIKLPWFAPTL
jgi:methylthioribose-1-phosphate isomerase